MADKSSQVILDALSRAAAEPAGAPLFAGKGAPGLFAVAARHAAQRCKDEGLVRVVRTETRGKTAQEICAITEKGLAHLLGQLSPKQVLEDLLRALEARQAQVGDLVTAARQTQAHLEALKVTAGKILEHVRSPGAGAATLPCDWTSPGGNGSETWPAAVLDHLRGWRDSASAGDCPLPELYRAARQEQTGLTLGRFHDGLRRLHEREQIYLHPWTGPLYDLPEPPCALLVGHEVAYYASLR